MTTKPTLESAEPGSDSPQASAGGDPAKKSKRKKKEWGDRQVADHRVNLQKLAQAGHLTNKLRDSNASPVLVRVGLGEQGGGDLDPWVHTGSMRTPPALDVANAIESRYVSRACLALGIVEPEDADDNRGETQPDVVPKEVVEEITTLYGQMLRSRAANVFEVDAGFLDPRNNQLIVTRIDGSEAVISALDPIGNALEIARRIREEDSGRIVCEMPMGGKHPQNCGGLVKHFRGLQLFFAPPRRNRDAIKAIAVWHKGPRLMVTYEQLAEIRDWHKGCIGLDGRWRMSSGQKLHEVSILRKLLRVHRQEIKAARELIDLNSDLFDRGESGAAYLSPENKNSSNPVPAWLSKWLEGQHEPNWKAEVSVGYVSWLLSRTATKRGERVILNVDKDIMVDRWSGFVQEML